MSKRKRTSNELYGDYVDAMFGRDLNSYLNNFQRGINFNNILSRISQEDIDRLFNIANIISNGFDINNMNFKDDNENSNFNACTYNSEDIVNFFNSLKPFMGVEINLIIDKFLNFYMDEINIDK